MNVIFVTMSNSFSMSRCVFGLFGPTLQENGGAFLSDLRRCDVSFGLCWISKNEVDRGSYIFRIFLYDILIGIKITSVKSLEVNNHTIS